jgi:hypothetical protein
MSEVANLILEAEHDDQDVPRRFELRRPSRNDISRATKGSDQMAANINLALACAIEPTREELGPLFDRYPALGAVLATELLKSVGGGVVFTVLSSKAQSVSTEAKIR